LVAFLSTEVIDRQSRGRKRKHAADESDGDDEASRTIGMSSVIGYLTALTALWAVQSSHGINPFPNPRADPAVKALVQSVPQRENERRYEEYHDRGEGTLADGYSPAQLANAVRHLWQSPTPELGLRSTTDLLIAHAMLLRAGSRVDIELPDMISLQLEGEGIASPCWPLVIVMRSGKTNRTGKVEQVAAFRHRDPLMCPQGAVARYLFWRL
jgi:hypothetical protein